MAAAMAAAMAAISVTRADRVESDRRLPSQRQFPRSRLRPAPLIVLFDAEIVAMLSTRPVWLP